MTDNVLFYQIEKLCPPKDGFSVVECLKMEYHKGTLPDKCMVVGVILVEFFVA